MIWPHVLGILLTLTLIAVMFFFVSEGLKNFEGRSEKEELRLWREFVRDFKEFKNLVREALDKPHPIYARVEIMPKTVNVGEVATVNLQVKDQFGNPFTLDASYQVAYSGSNPGAATFGTPNADGSDQVTAVAAEPSDQISATITGGPGGVNIVATPDVLTINAPVPVPTSASVVLS